MTIRAFRAEAEYQQRLGTKGILGSGTRQSSQTIPEGGTMRYTGMAGASFQALLGLSFPLVNQSGDPLELSIIDKAKRAIKSHG